MEQVSEAEKLLEKEQRALIADKRHSSTTAHSTIKDNMLPWETTCEVSSILSQDLMEKILALSQNESNFLEKPRNDLLNSQPFDFNAYVPVILKVLEVDYNLQRLHAKLVPKIKGGEEIFWRNYYLRILYIRACVGIDTAENDSQLLTLEGSELAACEERVRVTKLISKIPSSDVLFMDKVPPPMATANNNDLVKVKLGSDSVEATKRMPVVTGESLNKDCVLPGETVAVVGPYTSDSHSRSDRQLADEIEAELNECSVNAPHTMAEAKPGVLHNSEQNQNSLVHNEELSSTRKDVVLGVPGLACADDLELDELELELELEGLSGEYELDDLDELEDMILDEMEDEELGVKQSAASNTADFTDADKTHSLESSGVLVDGASISSGSLV